MFKKLLILAVLVGAGYMVLKKSMGLEDAAPAEVADILTERISAPIRDTQEATERLQKNQAERLLQASDVAAR